MAAPEKNATGRPSARKRASLGDNKPTQRVLFDERTRFIPNSWPGPDDDQGEAPPALGFGDAQDIAEIVNTEVTRCASAIQVKRIREAFDRLDRIEAHMRDLHGRAKRLQQDTLANAARLAGEGDQLPPYRVLAAAEPHLESLVNRWLPSGQRQQTARSGQGSAPVWYDKWRPVPITVSLKTGAWFTHDGDHGGEDLISLAAYLFDLNRYDATQWLAYAVGLREGRP